MTINELRNAYRNNPYTTDLAKVASYIAGLDRVSLICDEQRIYVEEIGKAGFTVEWVDFSHRSDGKVTGTDHKATAQAIIAGLAN